MVLVFVQGLVAAKNDFSRLFILNNFGILIIYPVNRNRFVHQFLTAM